MTDLATGSLPLVGKQLIEASAGTGKTYTITNLYIRLLLGRGRDRPLGVQQILVLTFTIAATEELKHRIRNRIVEAKRVFSNVGDQSDEFLESLKASSKDPQRDLKLLTAASLLMDDASIDPYAFQRDSWLQMRNAQINGKEQIDYDQYLDYLSEDDTVDYQTNNTVDAPINKSQNSNGESLSSYENHEITDVNNRGNRPLASHLVSSL